MAGNKGRMVLRRKPRLSGFSIGSILVMAVVMISTIFLGAWAVIEYLTAGARMWSDLESELALTADRLASSLSLDLWDVNYPQADAIALSAMGDRNVLRIEVVPTVKSHAPRVFVRGPQWEALKADGQATVGGSLGKDEGTLTAFREIEAQGSFVGSVSVSMTSRFLEAELEATMLRLAVAVCVLDGIMICALFFLLWFVVLKPLKAVCAYAAEVAEGRPASLALHWPGRELSAVSTSIGRMVELLERRYREAEASERRFKELFEHAPDAILELDGESGTILRANAAAFSLLGPRSGEEGARIGEFCLEESTSDFIMGRLAAAARGESASFERRVKTTTGLGALCAASLTPLPASEGKKTVRLSLVDVGEKRDLEERLRHAERLDAIGQLAGGVAHDFNNQLAGILGYAELLAERLPKGVEKEWAEGIINSATRASGLTRQLLAYARRGAFTLESVDIHALCRETAAFLERSIDKRIRISLDFHQGPAVVRGDPSQLQNALLNLAINARDAMHEGGTLTFSTRIVESRGGESADGLGDGLYLEAAVADTGIGMDDEIKKHLFEPFFTTKGLGKGTGLGLAAVYGTAKNHGGAIRVDSRLGRGTRMALLLPLGVADIRNDRAAGPDGDSTSSGGAVILIDDEAPIRDVCRQMLEDLGYDPIVCWDADSGIHAFLKLEGRAALVILDLVLPGTPGKDIFASLRAINPDARILIASGYALDGDAKTLLEAGAAGFIQKPFTKAELKTAMERAMGRTHDRVSGS